jgi:UTP--glucose-1-phosphate uridylyltransferase
VSRELTTLILPAAGQGSRMRKVSGGGAKEMLPLAGRPVIQYAVDEALDAGIKRLIVIVNRRKKELRRYLEGQRSSSLDILFLYQEEPAGEVDALSLAAPFAAGVPVAVLYPDNVHLPAPGGLKFLADCYRRNGHDVVGLSGMEEELFEATANAGRVDLRPSGGDLYQVVRLHAKQAGHFHPRFAGEPRLTGFAVYGPNLFTDLEEARKEVRQGEEFTDVPLRRRILGKRGLWACRLPGTVYDVGRPEGYALCRLRLQDEGTEARPA